MVATLRKQILPPVEHAWPEISLRDDAGLTLIRHDPTLGQVVGDSWEVNPAAVGRRIGVNRSTVWEVFTRRRELSRTVAERLAILHMRNAGIEDEFAAMRELCEFREQPAQATTAETVLAA